jgi:glucose/arabinose dehydrogenase
MRMSIRAPFIPRLVGLAAVGLVSAGCPGDDTTGSGTESATGTTSTSQGTADTTDGPSTVTMADTTMSTTTPSDTTETGPGETDESTDTTGDPPVECPYEEVMGTPPVALQLVGQGFNRPLLALGHPTEPDRLFVLEQNGNVRILEPDQMMAPAEAFLTVDVEGAGAGSIGAEFGLLGFAFHPDFPTDPRVYVNYNPNQPGPLHTIVSEFTLDAGNPNQVDPGSERIILDLHQPDSNHNGGMLQFDASGYLLIGMGDGGGGGDTYNTGRNTSVLLAKMLRIGVEPDGSDDDPVSCQGCPQYGPFDYTIPPDNPFVGDGAFAPEIYAWGLRNPWRFALDPETDLIYVGDVGQNQWEEITLANPGADLGWSDMEGFHCFGGAPCDTAAGPNEVNADGMTMPLVEYQHNSGRCSVTGGAVYRSCEVPAWDGMYLYGDFCSAEIFGLIWDGAAVTDLGVVLEFNELPLGNGWNAYGDVFITTVNTFPGGPLDDGLVYRVVPGA